MTRFDFHVSYVIYGNTKALSGNDPGQAGELSYRVCVGTEAGRQDHPRAGNCQGAAEPLFRSGGSRRLGALGGAESSVGSIGRFGGVG